METVVQNFKKFQDEGLQTATKLGKRYQLLFLPDFEATLANQKNHIINCVCEVYDKDKKHYMETTDGVFRLYRGTNKNESCHRRLNHLFPDQCVENTFVSFLTAFKFAWNIQRENGMQK